MLKMIIRWLRAPQSIFIVAVVVQIVFLFAGLDLHFSSSILKGITGYTNATEPLSKRLVLIVSDGLRADLLFNVTSPIWGEERGFVRDVMENRGVWGVSHVRMPTMSRPGFAAIVGGVYEDHSAVLTGYMKQPTQFDNVLSRAKQVVWTGESTVPIEFRGFRTSWLKQLWTTKNWLEAHKMYNFSILDVLAFDNMVGLLWSVEEELRVNTDKAIFVVYLDSTDASGHSWRPLSPKSIEAVKIIDHQLERITRAFEDRFNDKSTAFIFTSDHGMKDTGVHGGASANETQTPFLAWGSGVVNSSQALKRRWMKTRFQSSPLWRAEPLRRFDIDQQDIAPLIATLIGVPIPVNSMGLLPYEMLDSSYSHITSSLYMNYLQLAGLKMKHAERLQSGWVNAYVKSSEAGLEKETDLLLNSFWKSVGTTNCIAAIRTGSKLCSLTKKMIEFYQNSLNQLMKKVVMIGMVGYIVLLLEVAITWHNPKTKSPLYECLLTRAMAKIQYWQGIIAGIGGCVMCGLLAYTHNWSLQHATYFIVNVVVWCTVVVNMEKLLVCPLDRSEWAWMLWGCASSLITAYSLSKSFDYLRSAIAFMHLIAFLVMYKLKMSHYYMISWIFTGVLMAMLLTCDIMDKPIHSEFFSFGVISWMVYGLGFLYTRKRIIARECITICAFLTLISVAAWNMERVIKRALQKEKTTPSQVKVSWATTVDAFAILFIHRIKESHYLFCVSFALGTAFILTSIRHEAASFAILCFHLLLWQAKEIHWKRKRAQAGDDRWASEAAHPIRLGGELFLYLYAAFFLTGNTDDPTTFSISWTRAFSSEFSEKVASAIIIFKLLIPLIFTFVVFIHTEFRLGIPRGSLVVWFLFFNSLGGFYSFVSLSTEGTFRRVGYRFANHVMFQVFSISVALFTVIALICGRKAVPPENNRLESKSSESMSGVE